MRVKYVLYWLYFRKEKYLYFKKTEGFLNIKIQRIGGAHFKRSVQKKIVMKKKKEKPLTQEQSDDVFLKKGLFKQYYLEMGDKTEKYNKVHESNIDFYLAQTIPNRADIINQVIDLSYFYDQNFTGNKDFMHIPNFNQIANNLVNYPILLASQSEEDGSRDIVGVTTLKYEYNEDLRQNPYFPTRDENVLMITGVLTKFNAQDKNGNRIRGIGKELYKSSIKGAFELNKKKLVRLVCEIDCRNTNSLNSITKAVQELREEGYPVTSYVTGYYEIYGADKRLKEAPTFMVEFDLNGTKNLKDKVEFSYVNCKKSRLFTDLVNEIKEETNECRKYYNQVDDNNVIYHSIKPIDTQNIEIDVGDTVSGNDRVPELSPYIEFVKDADAKSEA